MRKYTRDNFLIIKGMGRVINYLTLGVAKYANGDAYEGDWKTGEMEGEGKYYKANGDRYDGGA
jgi:hypothetical protein